MSKESNYRIIKNLEDVLMNMYTLGLIDSSSAVTIEVGHKLFNEIKSQIEWYIFDGKTQTILTEDLFLKFGAISLTIKKKEKK